MGAAFAMRSIALPAALVIVVLAAYGRSLIFPFVQDDWGWMARFQAGETSTILKTIFSVQGNIFFRPLGELYLYLMHTIFGANPLPFHIVSISVFIASCWLVAAIMKILLRDGVIAWAAAFIYAMAAAVHLECLLWAVGIFDLAGSFFFLLALYLFLTKRPWRSALSFAAGCLFKESVIVLPFVAAAALLVPPNDEAAPKRTMVKRLVPLAIAFVAISIVRLLGRNPFSLPASYP